MATSASPLLRFYQPQPAERILLLEGDPGLAQQIAERIPQGTLLALARDVRQVAQTRALLTNFAHAQGGDAVIPEAAPIWDTVVLTVPKGRRYARVLILAAWQALRPGGQLLLIGAAQTGVNAVITDAGRLFGGAAVIGYKNHQRVARSIRGENLPTPLPPEFAEIGIAPGTEHAFTLARPSGVLTLATHPGIFSWAALDPGTALLLDQLQVQAGARVWDVGCGAGVIGLAAAQMGAKTVLMSDVNLLAVTYAQANAERNGLDNQIITQARDGLAADQGRWDLIISNPTFHDEHKVDTRMADALIQQAPQCLARGGRLVLVANRFLNYDRAMQAYFSRVTRLAETAQYHVIEAT